MSGQKLRMVSMFLVFATLTGCATFSDVVQGKEAGTAKVYPVTTDQAWAIAKVVLELEGANGIEEHREAGYMLTSRDAYVWGFGTLMGAWIEPVGEGQTKVTAVTKRRVWTNISTALTETGFHRRFAQGVEIVKAGGRSLPKSWVPD